MDRIRIGLISDTHGLLRPEAAQALQAVDHIIHAGDIGNIQILEQLADMAPVAAVRGNNDQASWADGLPMTTVLEIAGVSLYVLHDRQELDCDLNVANIQAVISGHSHRPSITTENSILFINPGSAGPRRFKLPVSIAILDIANGLLNAEIRLLNI